MRWPGFWSRAPIFALARANEGYEVVWNEAMAHGLPIVSCRPARQCRHTVGEGCGMLVNPKTPRQFAKALTTLAIGVCEHRWLCGQRPSRCRVAWMGAERRRFGGRGFLTSSLGIKPTPASAQSCRAPAHSSSVKSRSGRTRRPVGVAYGKDWLG